VGRLIVVECKDLVSRLVNYLYASSARDGFLGVGPTAGTSFDYFTYRRNPPFTWNRAKRAVGGRYITPRAW
jgi:hypothetical protein